MDYPQVSAGGSDVVRSRSTDHLRIGSLLCFSTAYTLLERAQGVP